MAQTYYRVQVHRRWWVRPLLGVAAFVASLGLRFDENRLAVFIVEHGMRAELVPE
ncbi:hypothetical protein [Methylorubrum extorquens]|uniref:hypothetical protein n=1 Tax=Methylorubrum extorquens TaxID=408 RepID=UPI0020A0CC6C|nr:hypothetical protein [Methylorubrum extorquens]MCP1539989.1 hypothetical protein [Methylorubrum extorquens]